LTVSAQVVEKLKEDKKITELLVNDAALKLLLKLRHAGLIESYVLQSGRCRYRS